MTGASLLRMADVARDYTVRGRVVHAVRGVSLDVGAGEAVGIIGESGSGKTTLGKLALGILKPTRGSVTFDGKSWGDGTRAEITARRAHISIVFQNPSLSLNPRMTVGASVLEPILLHRAAWSTTLMREQALKSLDLAHLPASVWDRYPRELSGGQQQRVAIARAVAVEPRLIVLDEPTAALDALVRRSILGTISELRERLGIAYLLITHDMETVAALAERTIVLYNGAVVEDNETAEVLRRPVEPYTRELMSAVLGDNPWSTKAAGT
jgi:ABC-type glutathione transport system ATPase component